MPTSLCVSKRSRLYKASILTYSCLYTLFAMPVSGTQSTQAKEERVRQALRDTCLYYEDQYKKQAFYPEYYAEAPTYDYRMIWFAARVLEKKLTLDATLLKRFVNGELTDEELIQLTQAHFSVIKKLPPKQATSNYERLELKKEIGARMALYFFRQKLDSLSKKEMTDHSPTQTVQNEKDDFCTFLTTNFLQYNIPGAAPYKLGIFSERHLEKNKKACEITLNNLDDDPEHTLLIEVKKVVIDRYKEGKKPTHKGINTREILTRYFSKKNRKNMTQAQKDRVVSCEYRNRPGWLDTVITFPKDKSERINELIYFTSHWHLFLKLKLQDIQGINQNAERLYSDLKNNPIKITNSELNDFYEKARARLLAKAQFRINELSAINPILEKKKDSTVRDVFGEDRNLVDALALCWNSMLDIQIFDDIIYYLGKGHTDLKTGSEHGYNLHAAIMYAVQSDEAFKESLKEWGKHYPTPVQARYAFARLKDLMEKEPLRVTVHTQQWKWGVYKSHAEFNSARIFSSTDTYHQGVAILQDHTSSGKQATVGIAHENIISIELNPLTPVSASSSNETSNEQSSTWVMAGGISALSAASLHAFSHRKKRRSQKKKEKKRSLKHD